MTEELDWSKARHGRFYQGHKLFLDDVREPVGPCWSVARNYDEFVAYLTKNGCPEIISFDHDLMEEHYQAFLKGTKGFDDTKELMRQEKTGYHCALWCVEHGMIPDLVIVHSFNPPGAINIANVFRGKTKVVIEPYKS